jgi:hypothetical protein
MPDRWQPIATAPRNGEPIDLWVPGTPEGRRHADAWWECVDDDVLGFWVRPAGQREPVRVDGATHWTQVPPPMETPPGWSTYEVVALSVLAFFLGAWVGFGIYAAIWGKP